MSMTQAAYSLAKVLSLGFDIAKVIQQLNPTAYETVMDAIVAHYHIVGLAHPAHDQGAPPANSMPPGKVNTEPPAKVKK
jgi:hypothetical protein